MGSIRPTKTVCPEEGCHYPDAHTHRDDGLPSWLLIYDGEPAPTPEQVEGVTQTYEAVLKSVGHIYESERGGIVGSLRNGEVRMTPYEWEER